jgi:DivIVA domain-containing protein
MSMREQDAPEFPPAFRGYDREQVDKYVEWIRSQAFQAEDRANQAEAALLQCRRELATSPTTAGISQRLAAMLQLATEEAQEIRSRAQAESDAMIAAATRRAEETIDEANRHRDAIQREIDELSTIREQLLQRLIELGGDVVGATERFRGFPPGTAPLTAPVAPTAVELYDAEAEGAVEPATDPGSRPEHDDEDEGAEPVTER